MDQLFSSPLFIGALLAALFLLSLVIAFRKRRPQPRAQERFGHRSLSEITNRSRPPGGSSSRSSTTQRAIGDSDAGLSSISDSWGGGSDSGSCGGGDSSSSCGGGDGGGGGGGGD